ncbi:Ser-Thr-rich glycosyl-phosphatidyl-inositol-anchored membrane family-domain-containing protein [Trichophaea hybrida]|nr:Ser-Thr-rich glycosyl-phosphatidyl-inositol-anchored membrane family-domain-containing protein [Trichophaea hybrida]
MRFLTTAVVAIATFTSAVYGLAAPATTPPVSGSANAITAPLGDTPLVAGKPYTIKWSHNFGDKVTLRLRKGDDSNNLDNVLTIVSDTSNDGEYTWTPPTQLDAGKNYAIEIVANGSANYSPKFEIDSNGSGVSSSKASSSAKPTKSGSEYPSSSAKPSASASGSAEPSSSASATSTDSSSSAAQTSITAPNEPKSAAGRMSSPLALVLCIVASLVYFH